MHVQQHSCDLADSFVPHTRLFPLLSSSVPCMTNSPPRLHVRLETGSGVPLTAQRGRHLLLQGVVARVRTGTAQVSGFVLGSGVGFTAVPTAANVNLHVRGHMQLGTATMTICLGVVGNRSS